MANDQDLILLNVTAKNGKAYSGQIAVDVHDLTNPIVDGGGSPVVVHVSNSTYKTQGDINNVDAWTVSDSISTIANQDLNLAILPITQIDSRGTQHPTTYAIPKNILFYLPNIVGAAEDVVTGGCSFLYNIQGDPIPVKYYSNLTVAQLISTAPVGGVTSVNGNTGPAVTLLVINAGTTGTLAWSGTTLNIPQAAAGKTGLLSSADFTTFSAKISGSGTTNYLSKFTAAGAIGNSQVFDDGTSVGIGINTGMTALLQIKGSTFDTGAVVFKVTPVSGTSSAIIDDQGLFSVTTDDSENIITAATTGAGSIAGFNADGATLAQYKFSIGGVEKGRIYANGSFMITRHEGIHYFNANSSNNTYANVDSSTGNWMFETPTGSPSAATALIHTAGGTTSRASMRIGAGVAPTSPNNGDLWSTASNAELVMRQNGSSNTLLGASAVTTEIVVSDTTVTVVIGGVTYKLLAKA